MCNYPNSFFAGGIEKISFVDPIPLIENEVRKLTAQGTNIIICLSNMGYTTDLAVAQEVEGLDVIVGGHSGVFLHTGRLTWCNVVKLTTCFFFEFITCCHKNINAFHKLNKDQLFYFICLPHHSSFNARWRPCVDVDISFIILLFLICAFVSPLYDFP